MNTFQKALFNLRHEIEESRQNTIKEKLPADLRTFYYEKLNKACNSFKENYLIPRGMGCMLNFDFAGSPQYLIWYQLHKNKTGRETCWFYVEPSYRIGYLESKRSYLKHEKIFSILETIPLDSEIVFPTYEEYIGKI